MRKIFILAFVAAAVLAPAVKAVPGMASLRPELVVVVLAVVVGVSRPATRGYVPRYLLMFTGIAVVAIGASYSIFAVPYEGRDLMIFLMLAQYWLVYSFGKSITRSRDRVFVTLATAVCVGVAALVGIGQKLNVFGVNQWLTPQYLPDTPRGELMLRALQQGASFARSVGTVGDPRHYALMLAVGVGAAMALLVHRRARWLGPLLLGSTALCILAAMFSMSRTGFVAIFVEIGIVAYLYYRRTRNAIVPAGVVVLFVVGLVLLWTRYAPEAARARLEMDPGTLMVTSGYARKRDLMEPFVKALKNPFVLITGQGPSKAVLPGSEHGDIGWVTLRYGLGGLIIYSLMMYRSVRQAVWMYRRTRSADEATVAMFCAMALGAWGLYILAESIFKLPQIMSINMLVVGMLFGFQAAAMRHIRVVSRDRRYPDLRRAWQATGSNRPAFPAQLSIRTGGAVRRPGSRLRAGKAGRQVR